MTTTARSGLFKEMIIKEPVTDLNLNWLTGNVALLPGEDENICVRQWADTLLGEQKLMRLSVAGNRLTIADGRKKGFPLGFNVGRTRLEITLPARQLRSMTIVLTGGKLLAEHLNVLHCQCTLTAGSATLSGKADELELSATGSTISGSQLETTRLNYRSVSTKTDLSGQFRHVDASVTGRSLHLTCLTMPESTKLHSTAAKAVIAFPGDAGFEALIDANSGKFTHAYASDGIRQDKKRMIYQSGGSPIHIGVRGGHVHLQPLGRV
jgi:hypothetical protein